MAGKPTIPPKTHERIRKLVGKGHTRAEIMEMIPCSLYTYRKALDPAYADREAERQRAMAAEVYAARREDPAYQEYQRAYNQRPEVLAKKREAERRRREARAAQA